MPVGGKRLKIKTVGHGGRKNDSPLDFGKSVNPISTGKEDYAHTINSRPPGFSDLSTALKL